MYASLKSSVSCCLDKLCTISSMAGRPVRKETEVLRGPQKLASSTTRYACWTSRKRTTSIWISTRTTANAPVTARRPAGGDLGASPAFTWPSCPMDKCLESKTLPMFMVSPVFHLHPSNCLQLTHTYNISLSVLLISWKHVLKLRCCFSHRIMNEIFTMESLLCAQIE